ncbi:hypothetical protein KZ483_01415 [Paenibacillus sp. sptzw28]|uniref:hypothetical protein n=1 Tax=Paenibacillus sp. sptzw28 TaxID=715179 RepID=UPI001C6E8F9F|nr:hypothetical protein [Paenibacillus sp. sptzw28]QYR21732.1 hypothetical protein KZ483_01415 [Paenibacillus sp. sptzw28]
MWKIAGWLVKTIAAGLIVSFLSIWTTGYVVNSYVETLLKQYKIPLDVKPYAMSGVWGGLWGANPELKQDAKQNAASPKTEDSSGVSGSGSSKAGESSVTGGSSSENSGAADGSIVTGRESGSSENTGSTGGSTAAGSGSGTSGTDGSPATGGTSGSAEDKADSGKEAPLAVDAYGDIDSGPLTDIGGGTGPKGNSGATSGNGSSGTQAGEASEDGMAMSTDQLNQAKSNMSEADKEQLFNLIMKKLPQDAWQRISVLLENGLTNEEMTEVQQLFAQHLDRSEYDSMMKILKKY